MSSETISITRKSSPKDVTHASGAGIELSASFAIAQAICATPVNPSASKSANTCACSFSFSFSIFSISGSPSMLLIVGRSDLTGSSPNWLLYTNAHANDVENCTSFSPNVITFNMSLYPFFAKCPGASFRAGVCKILSYGVDESTVPSYGSSPYQSA